MREAGRGTFVSVGSVADHVGFPENAAYAASKYGSAGCTRRCWRSPGTAAAHGRCLAEYRGPACGIRSIPTVATDSRRADMLRPDGRGGRRPLRRHPSGARAHRLAPSRTQRRPCLDHRYDRPDLPQRRSASRLDRIPRMLYGALMNAAQCRLASAFIGVRPWHRLLALCLVAPGQSAAAQAPDPAAARQHRLGRARARRRARSRAAPSGSAPTAGDLPPAGRGHRLGADPARHHRDARSPGTSCRRSRFGARGQIWYGTVGNGWGLSTDGGATWKNWTYDQLGPEWQYVAPAGIVVRGDTTVVATADGLQITTDDGANWTAIGDAVGPPARGPADTALPFSRASTSAGSPPTAGAGTSPRCAGASGCGAAAAGWEAEPLTAAAFPPAERAAHRQQADPRHPVRPPAERRHAALSPPDRRPPAEAPRDAAHHLAPAADRPDRQQLHRSDLPLRLDHGRQLPAAPGRRVQQSRTARRSSPSGRARWCTPGRPRPGR